MATRDELYTALRNADKAGDADGARKLAAYIQSLPADDAAQEGPTEEPFPVKLGRQVANAGAGALRGAGSIGATLLTPYDLLAGNTQSLGNPERRQAMDDALQSLGADTNSLAYGGGKLGAEIGGTLGVGGALAGGARALGAAPGVVNALSSAGMTGPNMLTRMLGGAATGGASAGLVDPQGAGTGTLVGAALPPALKAAGAAGDLIGKGAKAAGSAVFGSVSPEVAALAKRAQELGIDVPVDRLLNSKPLDAVASGLNYVPFSGRAATEANMASQLNRAGSRLMGQDTANMNVALRRASADLGAKFDTVLKNTGVAFDEQLLKEATTVVNKARDELGDDAFRAIDSKFKQLVEKGADGIVDGNAAYVIKRDLDRIGRGNSPNAYHALELKGVLLDALNRSLGPDGAKAFAQTRTQYSNMLALEKLAKNGVEGEISVARLANLRNINNQPLQELADIAAQFVKAREGQHGAMQRAIVGLGAGAAGGAPGMTGVAAAGRGTNMLLNSGAIRNQMLGEPVDNALARLMNDPSLAQFGYRALPLGLAGGQ